MTPQYIAVRFRPADTRTYTYVNNGPPVTVGDKVKVPDNRSDGWNAVEVVEVVDPPRFACKPILGKADGEAIDERLLKGAAPELHRPDLFRDYVEDARSGLAGPDLFASLEGE